jgi:N-acetylmuramoyl-L-alanine amidase
MRVWPLLACLLFPTAASAQDVPARGKPPVVFIDAGHGGKMGGAVGVKGEPEKNVTLQIARRLRDALQKRLSATVLLTRDADVDVDLYERMAKANAAKAQVFVSVHCNAMPLGPVRGGARGVETYFLSAEATGEQAARVAARENAEAHKQQASGDTLAGILADLAQTEAHHDASALAYAVHQRLVKDLGAADRGVHQAPFIVLMGAQMPAILVEVGFITSPLEGVWLSDKAYQEKIADALVDGIAAYLGEVANRR